MGHAGHPAQDLRPARLAHEQSGPEGSQHQPLRHVRHPLRQGLRRRRSLHGRQRGYFGVSKHQSNDFQQGCVANLPRGLYLNGEIIIYRT